MKLEVTLPRATVLYFNAFDRSRGVHITSNELSFRAQFGQPQAPDTRSDRSGSPLADNGSGSGDVGSRETLELKDFTPSELVCTSVDCEIAAVRATALKYNTERKEKKEEAAEEEEQAKTTATMKKKASVNTSAAAGEKYAVSACRTCLRTLNGVGVGETAHSASVPSQNDFLSWNQAFTHMLTCA